MTTRAGSIYLTCKGIKDVIYQPGSGQTYSRVPTSSENHGKPGKSLKSSNHGKIMEFEKIPE